MSFFSDFKRVIAMRLQNKYELESLIDNVVLCYKDNKIEPMYVVYIDTTTGKGVTYQFSSKTLNTNADFVKASDYRILPVALAFATPVCKAKKHINENGQMYDLEHCYQLDKKCYLAYASIEGEKGSYILTSKKPSEHAYKVNKREGAKKEFLNQFNVNKKEIIEELSEKAYYLHTFLVDQVEQHNESGYFAKEYALVRDSLMDFEKRNPELVEEVEKTLEMNK